MNHNPVTIVSLLGFHEREKHIIKILQTTVDLAVDVAKGMSFATAIAHRRMSDYNSICDQLKNDVLAWLKDNFDSSTLTKEGIDDLLHDLVLFVRQRTEELLEVNK